MNISPRLPAAATATATATATEAVGAFESPLLDAGACLDDLLVTRFFGATRLPRIRRARGLPDKLRDFTRLLAARHVWRAYGDRRRLLFAVARGHAADPLDEFSASLELYLLDANAMVYAAGVWEYEQHKGWWLDDVLKLSYDCEHGWWLDALVNDREPREAVGSGQRSALELPRLRGAGAPARKCGARGDARNNGDGRAGA